MLKERRQFLHERTGAGLESIYADNLDDHVAELAHHYTRNGNPGKAVKYCLRAVRQCTARGSYAEAFAQFETGLELLPKLPDDDQRAELELDLRNASGLAVGVIKGWRSPDAERSSERAIALCQRPGLDWRKTWSALRIVFLIRWNSFDLRKA